VSTPAEQKVEFNPFDPAFRADPYPSYEMLREKDPVYQNPLGFILLSRYDDVDRFLREPGLSVEDANSRPSAMDDMIRQLVGDERYERGSQAMLNRDPPDHTRLRKLVSKAFTPRAI